MRPSNLRTMNSRNKKALTVVGGVSTVVVALTAASRKQRWQKVHTLAVVVGGVVVILGALA